MSDEKAQKTEKVYKCPKCKNDLGVSSLNPVAQPLYVRAMNPPAREYRGRFDAEIWAAAKSFKGPFSSSDLYKRCIDRRIKDAAKAAAEEGKAKSPTLDFSYSTVRARIQRWKDWGRIHLCEEKRAPQPIVCPSCGQSFDPHAVVGAFSSSHKRETATKTMLTIAVPRHQAKLPKKVWTAVCETSGEFSAQDIYANCPDTSFSTVRQQIYKWAAEGKLVQVSFGRYVKKDEVCAKEETKH